MDRFAPLFPAPFLASTKLKAHGHFCLAWPSLISGTPARAYHNYSCGDATATGVEVPLDSHLFGVDDFVGVAEARIHGTCAARGCGASAFRMMPRALRGDSSALGATCVYFGAIS